MLIFLDNSSFLLGCLVCWHVDIIYMLMLFLMTFCSFMVAAVNFSFHFLFCLFIFYLLSLIFLLNLTRVLFCFLFVCFPVSVSSVQSLSSVRLFATPGTSACQASVSINNCQSWLKLIVHQVGDAIQPAYPLLSPYPPAFNLSHHQGLFQGVSSSHQVPKVLELQHQSFQ